MSIESEARGISQRHQPVDRYDFFGQPVPEPRCSTCGYFASWPCRDRLAADAITQAEAARNERERKVIEHLEAIRQAVRYQTNLSRNSVQDLWAIESLLTDVICEHQEHAVAALAILGGSDE